MEAKEASNELLIKEIRREDLDGSSRIVCPVEMTTDNGETETREIFFEVPSEYGEYLVYERCDAIVIGLLRYAISKGFNISSRVPMSEDLHRNIVEDLLPPLSKNGIPDAMGRLGMAYRYGRVVSKNLNRAEKWLSHASAKDPGRWERELGEAMSERSP